MPTTEETFFTDALIIWPKVSGGYQFGALLYDENVEYSIYIDSEGNALLELINNRHLVKIDGL